MEKKVNNESRILESAHNILEQINSLLVSAANPSDETSLSIRLSLIKVNLSTYIQHKNKCINVNIHVSAYFLNIFVMHIVVRLHYVVLNVV